MSNEKYPVRIITLPSMTVAAIHVVGQDENGNHAEHTGGVLMEDFIRETNLKSVYPAARRFGFNNPDGIPDDDPAHGYENWVSIPEDMEVPAPFVKKRLEGGLYAAKTIPDGAWDEGWLPLHGWVNSSDTYDFRWETVEGVCGWLEEPLNHWNWDSQQEKKIDLLMPVKRRGSCLDVFDAQDTTVRMVSDVSGGSKRIQGILCDGMKGENYWLHGCMKYIAACLDLPTQYNYQFFNCYSGDSVMQIFAKNPSVEAWSYSHECTREALERCFFAIGHDFTYIASVENAVDWLPRIRESIDCGLPVIARGGGKTDGLQIDFNCIVGYDDGALYYLFCDKEQPSPATEYDFTELVFIGEKISDPIPLAEGYMEALCRVPSLLTKPATEKLSFGIQAFEDWADQLSDGSLADYDNQNVWSVHGTYLCMLGSNSSGFGLFDKVMEYHPEMTWLADVKKQYDELSDIFQTLAYRDGGVCGGFDMRPEDVRDPEKMRPACALIRRAAKVTRMIAECIKGHALSDLLTTSSPKGARP